MNIPTLHKEYRDPIAGVDCGAQRFSLRAHRSYVSGFSAPSFRSQPHASFLLRFSTPLHARRPPSDEHR
ncbi:hypothetical protein BURPS1710A_A1997 [Burkholderia pseudomallei 1710a]|uniref:Uncharacterized protein n=1 Tax=Burkholderia pseudomallei 1710a TaxID=320371 RepID=A0A0E1VPK8_BURPE|nr:hypothetical protein BURPS1710A_A1997 [Burkholderia pseudomallei 1710a]